jgi:hypothetical protein
MTEWPVEDLERLADDWQAIDAPGPAPEAIRRYVRARSRLLRVWMAGELLLGAVVFPVLVYLAWTARDLGDRIAMSALAALTVAAVWIAAWNWHGVLCADAETTSAFVALSIRRLGRVGQAYRVGWLVLVFEVVILGLWIWSRFGTSASAASMFAWGLLTVMTAGATVFLLALRRWIVREQDRFEAVRRELSE